MSTPKKPGTDLAALKARLAKKNKKAAPAEAAPAAAPVAAEVPPPGQPAAAPAPAPTPAPAPQPQAAPTPAPQPEYAAPVAAAPQQAAPQQAAPQQQYQAPAPAAAPAAPASDDPFGGGGGGGFDPSEGLIDSGGEIQAKSNIGASIFIGILGVGAGLIGGYFISDMTKNSAKKEAATSKGAEMVTAVKSVVDARTDISIAMEKWEKDMVTDPAGTATAIDTLLKEKFSKKVDVNQLFGWQLAAVNSNGVMRTFELFDEATRVKKDLGYLSAFLSSQEKALKESGGPSQFAVKFTDKGTELVAALSPMCPGGEAAEGAEAPPPKPCAEGEAGGAVAYQVLESLGSDPVTLPRGTGNGQVMLLRPRGAIYEYAVGMEPKRNALIMRNALLKRAKDHLEEMNKIEKASLKALEKYAADPDVDGSNPQPDPEAGE